MARWVHKDVARRYYVPEDVVRRIYATVQTAKKQGLYGGDYADCVERNVGRKLVGNEYTVSAKAKEHLSYDPPGGYHGGPKARGRCKPPPRWSADDPKARSASEIASSANAVIKTCANDRGIRKDRELVRHAADELDVAADLYEEAGAKVRAGTLRMRAEIARDGDYDLLKHYD